MEDNFKTISSKAEGIFKDKGSKFFAFAFPVTNEDEVKEHIQVLKKEHHNARHHCFAYRLGPTGEKYRANDDGEPSGTGGKPILGQLLSYDVSNVLIVVVRYFGGTLLGVGGLINAYKNAAADALNNSDVITKIITCQIFLEFEYSLQNLVMRTLKEENAELLNAEYTSNCRLKVEVRKNNYEILFHKLLKIQGLHCE